MMWMGTLHWLRLPHPATSVGWVALSFYLAWYVPAFVALTRVAIHKLRISVVVAAPVAWMGLEYAQAHFLTGFSMASLAHTQVRWPGIIQAADLGGQFLISGLIVFVAACLARMVPLDNRRWTVWPLCTLVLVMAGFLAYGAWRIDQTSTLPGLKVALIQGNTDSEMKDDPGRQRRIHEEYFGLSQKAVRAHQDLDLIVWPETMYRNPLWVCEPGVKAPPDYPHTLAHLKKNAAASKAALEMQAVWLKCALILGVDTMYFDAAGRARHYNSAAFVDRRAKLQGRYDKVHPVLFGEYVPLANRIPWLYKLTPLRGGLDEGQGPVAFNVAGRRLSANICFESCTPHVVRRQVAELASRGQEPDVLVNLSNDGWFWGSSELDLHLLCGVFRAVECRKPLLIAANTGFSAWIDANGRLIKQGPRRAPAVLVADVQIDGRSSLYVQFGDWPSQLCLGACLLVGMAGWVGRARRTASPTSGAAAK